MNESKETTESCHTSQLAHILKRGWNASGSQWIHVTAARKAGLPDAVIVVRTYPWERRGTRAPKLLASFEAGPHADLGEVGGNTRWEAAADLIRAAMARG